MIETAPFASLPAAKYSSASRNLGCRPLPD
jgi:hypothetical protein